MSDYGFLVVARHRDGRLVRGTSSDFRPDRTLLSITDELGEPHRIDIDELKALFFVKNLFGNHSHDERKTFRYRDGQGRKAWIEFTDGEELAGWVDDYDPKRTGFFLFPTDANSNLEKVWVVFHSTHRILFDEDAIAASEAHERAVPQRRTQRGGPDRWDEMLGLRPEDYRKPRLVAAEPPPVEPKPKKRDSGIFLGDW
ncbi:MAG: hypothetical protein R3B81_18835 [bacterium]